MDFIKIWLYSLVPDRININTSPLTWKRSNMRPQNSNIQFQKVRCYDFSYISSRQHMTFAFGHISHAKTSNRNPAYTNYETRNYQACIIL